MNEIKIIKTEKEYEAALKRIEALMDAAPGSSEEEELDLLALVVEKYEDQHYPIDTPDPIDAITFRMEQQGLTPKDMVKYLGSQSKVSEVLNRKRPLSLAMIRNLHRGLGIPAEALLGDQPARQESTTDFFQHETAVHELFYFNCPQLATEFQQDAFRKWIFSLTEKATKQKLPPFDPQRVNQALFTELARLGSYSAGPQMAHELLNKRGIYFTIKKIPFESELDGACFITPKKRPVVALTLRDNRLDDFWLTILHLLAHLYLIRGERPAAYFDSIECILSNTAPAEEEQANELLKEFLAPAFSSRSDLISFLKAGDYKSLNQALGDHDISPEIFYCWARLEKENIYQVMNAAPPKKVSDRLEVYG